VSIAADSELVKRGWGDSVGFGQRPALMVIDLSRAFTDPTTDLGSDCSAVIEGANELLHAFRSAGHPIFFSTIAYRDPETESGIWLRKIRGLNVLVTGSPWVEQDPRLARDKADVIIVKRQASCFFETGFQRALEEKNIDTLVLAGVSTSGCVRATAVDAAQLGYHVVVAEEAVGDRLADAHQQSLRDINLKYGDVLGNAELLDRLAAGSGAHQRNRG
jgi:nicotinamidase-related amidase